MSLAMASPTAAAAHLASPLLSFSTSSCGPRRRNHAAPLRRTRARLAVVASVPDPAAGPVEYTPWLIAGLGNPGAKYHGTRHNVGFEMVDRIARDEGIAMNTIQSKSLLGKATVAADVWAEGEDLEAPIVDRASGTREQDVLETGVLAAVTVPDCWEDSLEPGTEAWSDSDTAAAVAAGSADACLGSPIDAPLGAKDDSLCAAGRAVVTTCHDSPLDGFNDETAKATLAADGAFLHAVEDLGASLGLVDLVDAPAGSDDAPIGGLVHSLFARPDVPLLPRPVSPGPSITAATPTVRRSARLNDKPPMPTIERAVRLLNQKMGIAVGDDIPLVAARKQYEAAYKNQLPDVAVHAFAQLFKLKMPCLDAATDALITMAGPGGADLAPSADREVNA